MIDEHRVAGEEELTRIEDRSGDRQRDRGADSAAMSIPLCGLRDSPLNMRRIPNELLRTPGTGGAQRSVSGGGSLQWLVACSTRSRSRLARARSAADRFTWRGATLSD